jgi:hypothetical protein
MTARRRARSARRAPTTRKTAPKPTPVAPPPPPPTPPPPARVSAEALLLDLARMLSAPPMSHAGDLAAVVSTTAAAYAPDAPIAAALRADWPRITGDKAARLAFAWAREQVRLALRDVLQRARAAHAADGRHDTDTLAWLWLAACEGLAHEPPDAVDDRVHALLAFLTDAAC